MNEIISKIKKEMEKQGLSTPKMLLKIGVSDPSLIRKTNRCLAGESAKIDVDWLTTICEALGIVAEPVPQYGVSKIFEGLTPAEAEAIKILRECPEALSVVQMMGGMDRDTQKRVQDRVEEQKLMQDMKRVINSK